MAPLLKQEISHRRNLRCYFKRSLNKFKLPIIKMANVLKTALGFGSIKNLALTNWDILNQTVSQCDDDDNSDEEYTDIFTKLLLK